MPVVLGEMDALPLAHALPLSDTEAEAELVCAGAPERRESKSKRTIIC